MSFILDALKKSEAARQRQMTPGLIEPGFRAQRRLLPLWAVVLLLLLGVNLAVLSVILVGRATHAPDAAAISTASTPSLAVATAAAPAPAPAPAPAVKPFSPMDGSAVNAPEIPLAPAGDAPAASPPRRAAAAAAAGTQPQPVEDEDILPTIDTLNLRAADALPPLHLDVHVYAANPADRFVYINSRKYAEGSTLREGPTVERIRRDGVVLNYHGIRFLLPRR